MLKVTLYNYSIAASVLLNYEKQWLTITYINQHKGATAPLEFIWSMENPIVSLLLC